MADQHVPIIMEEVTDPEELAQAHVRNERFACATPHGYKGTPQRFIRSIAASASVWQAKSCSLRTRPKRSWLKPEQHIPKEGGSILIRYIPRDKVAHIYAY
jgi:hypothetical protein